MLYMCLIMLSFQACQVHTKETRVGSRSLIKEVQWIKENRIVKCVKFIECIQSEVEYMLQNYEHISRTGFRALIPLWPFPSPSEGPSEAIK
jgi:hypothetical protein